MKRDSFYNEIAKTNTMPDGMLNSIKYEDYALYIALKDKPVDKKHEKKYDIEDTLE